MELKLSHALLAVSTAILLSAAPLISQQQPLLNNTDIVKMVKDGMADSAITSALDYRYAWRWAIPLSVAYR
jgi:hypothetical protein